MSDRVEGAIRLGARGSRLARWQADWVAEQLRAAGHTIEIIEIRTRGDVQQVGPISAIVEGTLEGTPVEGSASTGGQGVFTKEIQRALLSDEIDLAVHSLKDLPTTPVAGLTVAAVPVRAPIADALISHVADSIDSLPQGARVGTGSFRRRAQLLSRRPDLIVKDLRGNVETRLAKLDLPDEEGGEYDAILLAEAGLTRLGLANRITCQLAPPEMLPAPGQGALGIECRADDERTLAVLAPLNDAVTRAAVTAERTALARLEGGCLAALGAWGRIEGQEDPTLLLLVVVLSEDGTQRLDAEATGSVDEAEDLGTRVADDLLARGAAALLRDR